MVEELIPRKYYYLVTIKEKIDDKIKYYFDGIFEGEFNIKIGERVDK